LEELVTDREKAAIELHQELDKYVNWAKELDAGRYPEGLQEKLRGRKSWVVRKDVPEADTNK
jgi:hypothetical protein